MINIQFEIATILLKRLPRDKTRTPEKFVRKHGKILNHI